MKEVVSIPSSTTPTADADRRRAMVGLFACAAFASTGYIPALSVAPLAAEDMLGSPRWSGVPGAVTVAGMALGASLLSSVMARRSRRFGLLLGFAVATAAAGLTALAVGIASFPLFLLAMAIFGGGYSSRHLARYVAGDLYRRERRATAIGLVVWAATVGSIVAPLLLEPSQRWAEGFGASGLVGPYLLATVATFVAWSFLFLVPASSPAVAAGSDDLGPESTSSLGEIFGPARTKFALAALMVGQFVMVLIMSMTPIHIRHAGGGLWTVGLVFAAHTLGMFGLSPLTGVLSDRWGRIPVILVGEAMLIAAALMAAPSHGSEQALLVGSLFLLGLGWNFGFVAASALLTESIPAADRLRAQGTADTMVWATAALGNFTSGLVLAGAGYAALNLLGASLVLVPLLMAWRSRRHLGAGAPPRSV